MIVLPRVRRSGANAAGASGSVRMAPTIGTLADGQAGGAVPQLGDDTRQLVSGHTRRPVTTSAVGPRCLPVQFSPGEPRGMHLHDDVVLGGVGRGGPSPGGFGNRAFTLRRLSRSMTVITRLPSRTSDR